MIRENWNTLTLPGGLPDDLVRSLSGRSYDLVLGSLSRKQRENAGLSALPGKNDGKK